MVAITYQVFHFFRRCVNYSAIFRCLFATLSYLISPVTPLISPSSIAQNAYLHSCFCRAVWSFSMPFIVPIYMPAKPHHANYNESAGTYIYIPIFARMSYLCLKGILSGISHVTLQLTVQLTRNTSGTLYMRIPLDHYDLYILYSIYLKYLLCILLQTHFSHCCISSC